MNISAETIARILAEVDKHEAVDRDYAEGWHAAIASIRIRLEQPHTR